MTQLFKIQDVQSGPGENGVMNVYWLYNSTSSSKSMPQVGNAFADQMVDLVRFIQSVNWEHTHLLITDVLTGLSALFNLIGFLGQRSSESTPASNAWSFSQKPIGPILKRGGKRLVGVTESDSTFDVASTAAAAILSAMTIGFYAPIVVDGVPMSLSCVRPVGNPVTSYIISPFVSAVYRAIGTQVTRKLGRGGVGTSSSFLPHENLEKETAFESMLTEDPADWVDAVTNIVDARIAEYTYVPETEIVL